MKKTLYLGMVLKTTIFTGAVIGTAQTLPVMAEDRIIIEEAATVENQPEEKSASLEENVEQMSADQTSDGDILEDSSQNIDITQIETQKEMLDKKEDAVISTSMQESLAEEKKTESKAAVSFEGQAGSMYNQADQNKYDFIDDQESITAASLILDKKHTLSLNGDIGVNFYYKLNKKVADEQNASFIFTVDDKTETISWKDAMIREISGVPYHRFSIDVASTQMMSAIEAKIAVGDKILDVEKYSVRDYCNQKLGDPSSSEDLKELLYALLNYGSKAQKQFDYNTGNLADSGMNEYDMPEISADTLKKYAPIKTGDEEGLKYIGSSLVLDSKTTVRLFFTVDDDHDIDNYTFRADGKVVTPIARGSRYFIDIPDISGKNLDQSHIVSAGNLIVKYNALSYAYTVLKSDSISETLKNTVNSLYIYNKAAKNYFETFDESLNKYLYSYDIENPLDISKYGLTYLEATEKVTEITKKDKTFDIFAILVNNGHTTTGDYSEKAKTIKMILPDTYRKQYDLLDSVNSKINDIIAEIRPEWSDFEKALFVHDWICLNSDYKETAQNAHDLSGTLLDGLAVCQSFTNTFNTIMYRIGVPVETIYGNNHMWSEICLDGKWYQIDITQDNLFNLGGVSHLATFVSRDKYFNFTKRNINKCRSSYSKSMSEDLATNTNYEEHDEKIGLFQKNMWRQETTAFQYYDGYWYTGGERIGVYDPRIDKYTTSNEVWVYQYDPETKEFNSIDVGLPKGEWNEDYRGLFIVGDTAFTRTGSEFMKISLKTGETEKLLTVGGTIRDYYTDYTGVIRYRLTDDKTVYKYDPKVN